MAGLSVKRPIHRVIGLVVLAALASTTVLATSRIAVAASNYEAVAGASGARTVVRYEPEIVTAELVDPGSSQAQALLNSLGESIGFASNPYPGALPIAAPGLVDGLSGVTDLPEYPFYVQSSYPGAPDEEISVGTMRLAARSLRESVTADATAGGDRSFASVELDPSTDTVTASATTSGSASDAGPLFVIDGVRSRATVTRRPGGDPERSSELHVARFEVLGQRLVLTPNGIELPGQDPLGADVSGGVNALLGQLGAAGIQIRYVDPVETENGIIAGGITVTRVEDLGDSGTVTSTTTYGRAYAEVSNTPRATIDLGGLLPVPTSEGPTPTPIASPNPVATPPVTAAPRPVVSAPPVIVAEPTQPAISPTETATTNVPPAALASTRGLQPETVDARFYPMLLVAALGLMAVFNLFRVLGRKESPWTS